MSHSSHRQPQNVETLLSTKLNVPSLPTAGVRRARIIKALATRARARLVLVSAPAGYGKSTAVTQWAREAGKPIAWLSLDEADRDPHRFLAYLAAALQRVRKSLGDGALASLSAPITPTIDSVINRLINELERDSTDVTVVLDDYQVLVSSPTEELLSTFLERLPQTTRVVIVTRVDPDLPLSRHRARGELREIGQRELRFSRGEASRFLSHTKGLKLDSDTVAELARRTEGWIAGLQLAAFNLLNEPEPSRFLQSFGGSQQHLFDYLADEVLTRQSDRVRQFLVKTSVLSRLHADLCRAMTGDSSAQGTLEFLRGNNVFLEALDDTRSWYRYHQLFADFLQKVLRRTYPRETIHDLHRRAADWLASHHFEEEAVRHSLLAGDGHRAAHIVEQALPRLASRSETYPLVVELVTKLPRESVRDRPRLALECAWALILSGRTGDPESLLASAEASLETSPAASTGELKGLLSAIRSTLAGMSGRVNECEREGRRALKLLPKENLRWLATVNVGLGLARLVGAQPARAELALKRAADLSLASGDRPKALWAIEARGCAMHQQGRLREAARIFQDGIELTNQLGRYRSTWQGAVGGASYVGLARILLEWDDVADAEKEAEKGLHLAGDWDLPDVLADVVIPGNVTIAMSRFARNDSETWGEALDRAERVAVRLGRRHSAECVEASRVTLWTRAGEDAHADRWLQSLGMELEDLVRDDEIGLELAIAGVRVILSQRSRSRKGLRALSTTLGRWSSKLHEQGMVDGEIDVLILQCLSEHAQGRMGEAEGVLRRALVMAEPGGYVRKFVDEGLALAYVLSRVFRSSVRTGHESSKPYLMRLLRASGVETSIVRGDSGRTHVELAIEPLTHREMDVLKLVHEGLSNAEIRSALSVSLGTVKRHLSNIFLKLGVHSRTAALAKARELQLL